MKKIFKIEEDVEINEGSILLEKGDIIKITERDDLEEAAKYSKEDIGYAISNSFDELEDAIKNVRNIENWAEKYVISANGLIDLMDRITSVFKKIK